MKRRKKKKKEYFDKSRLCECIVKKKNKKKMEFNLPENET